ncbi:hypothetical protein BMS3Abin09_00678 [bacterium BMS3Abin09]|nr:hypothetical protein BMS3Abin09_00678 [bacterium BMS3Abin09]GBE40652.1 hypothetical protein BMS3Bbin09_00538 [bacterium BMS3Bbin09]
MIKTRKNIKQIDVVGGRAWYSRHPKEVKEICCGLKRSLILRKFHSAA